MARIAVEKDNELKIEITSLSQTNPKWKGKEIQAVLEKDERFQNRVPSVRTIQNVVKKNKERKQKKKGDNEAGTYNLYSLWSMGSLDEYPVLADAIPIILEIQKNIDKNITVRIVKWLARLNIILKGNGFLYWWASLYAREEEFHEVADIPFDTSEFDAKLLDHLFSMPVAFEFFHTFTQWLMTEYKYISEEEKQSIGQLFAQRIEESFVGHKVRSWKQGKSGEMWLIYVCAMIAAWKFGYFGKITNIGKIFDNEGEARLMKLREKLPEIARDCIKKDSINIDYQLFKKVVEDLEVEKE